MDAKIICIKYYDTEKESFVIGGIETYVRNLICVLNELGFNVVIYQFGKKYSENILPGCKVIDVPVNYNRNIRYRYSQIVKFLEGKVGNNDLVIFGSDDFIAQNSFQHSIAIQHGISWDVSSHVNVPEYLNNYSIYWKAYRQSRRIKNLSYVNKIVCVDYNFLNWIRASLLYVPTEMSVIPNFTTINYHINKSKDNIIRIIFARRFYQYRGTRIFANAIHKILCEFDNVRVTIAGSGPDEEYMRNVLKDQDHVVFRAYKSEDSMMVHSNQDIAVVPTIGSEGTSLSLLEAMGSGCAVICSNVGGMTNIVIDNFNGLMIDPTEEQLYLAIRKLVLNENLRNRLADEAIKTALTAFNKETWIERWKVIIQEEMKC